MVNRAASASTVTVWMLRVTVGSAQIRTFVRTGPTPASARAAATLTLAGNPAAASSALPSKTTRGFVTDSTSMSCFARYGAPARPRGGFRVSSVTLWIGPSAAARTASRPSSAPVGTMMRAPVAWASLTRCMRGSRAPTEAGIRMRPASMAGKAIRSNRDAGAASTTISASDSSASSTIGGGSMKPARLAMPLTRSRHATATNRRPSIRASSARASGNPIAPSPAIATVLVIVLSLTAGPFPSACEAVIASSLQTHKIIRRIHVDKPTGICSWKIDVAHSDFFRKARNFPFAGCLQESL